MQSTQLDIKSSIIISIKNKDKQPIMINNVVRESFDIYFQVQLKHNFKGILAMRRKAITVLLMTNNNTFSRHAPDAVPIYTLY